MAIVIEPGEIEIDIERGVMYFHSSVTGTSRVRICGLDKGRLRAFLHDEKASIDVTLKQNPGVVSYVP